MITVQISLDGPREVSCPTPAGYEDWDPADREAFIGEMEQELIDSTVAFSVDDGQEDAD